MPAFVFEIGAREDETVDRVLASIRGKAEKLQRELMGDTPAGRAARGGGTVPGVGGSPAVSAARSGVQAASNRANGKRIVDSVAKSVEDTTKAMAAEVEAATRASKANGKRKVAAATKAATDKAAEVLAKSIAEAAQAVPTTASAGSIMRKRKLAAAVQAQADALQNAVIAEVTGRRSAGPSANAVPLRTLSPNAPRRGPAKRGYPSGLLNILGFPGIGIADAVANGPRMLNAFASMVPNSFLDAGANAAVVGGVGAVAGVGALAAVAGSKKALAAVRYAAARALNPQADVYNRAVAGALGATTNLLNVRRDYESAVSPALRHRIGESLERMAGVRRAQAAGEISKETAANRIRAMNDVLERKALRKLSPEGRSSLEAFQAALAASESAQQKLAAIRANPAVMASHNAVVRARGAYLTAPSMGTVLRSWETSMRGFASTVPRALADARGRAIDAAYTGGFAIYDGATQAIGRAHRKFMDFHAAYRPRTETYYPDGDYDSIGSLRSAALEMAQTARDRAARMFEADRAAAGASDPVRAYMMAAGNERSFRSQYRHQRRYFEADVNPTQRRKIYELMHRADNAQLHYAQLSATPGADTAAAELRYTTTRASLSEAVNDLPERARASFNAMRQAREMADQARTARLAALANPQLAEIRRGLSNSRQALAEAETEYTGAAAVMARHRAMSPAEFNAAMPVATRNVPVAGSSRAGRFYNQMLMTGPRFRGYAAQATGRVRDYFSGRSADNADMSGGGGGGRRGSSESMINFRSYLGTFAPSAMTHAALGAAVQAGDMYEQSMQQASMLIPPTFHGVPVAQQGAAYNQFVRSATARLLSPGMPDFASGARMLSEMQSSYGVLSGATPRERELALSRAVEDIRVANAFGTNNAASAEGYANLINVMRRNILSDVPEEQQRPIIADALARVRLMSEQGAIDPERITRGTLTNTLRQASSLATTGAPADRIRNFLSIYAQLQTVQAFTPYTTPLRTSSALRQLNEIFDRPEQLRNLYASIGGQAALELRAAGVPDADVVTRLNSVFEGYGTWRLGEPGRRGDRGLFMLDPNSVDPRAVDTTNKRGLLFAQINERLMQAGVGNPGEVFRRAVTGHDITGRTAVPAAAVAAIQGLYSTHGLPPSMLAALGSQQNAEQLMREISEGGNTSLNRVSGFFYGNMLERLPVNVSETHRSLTAIQQNSMTQRLTDLRNRQVANYTRIYNGQGFVRDLHEMQYTDPMRHQIYMGLANSFVMAGFMRGPLAVGGTLGATYGMLSALSNPDDNTSGWGVAARTGAMAAVGAGVSGGVSAWVRGFRESGQAVRDSSGLVVQSAVDRRRAFWQANSRNITRGRYAAGILSSVALAAIGAASIGYGAHGLYQAATGRSLHPTGPFNAEDRNSFPGAFTTLFTGALTGIGALATSPLEAVFGEKDIGMFSTGQDYSYRRETGIAEPSTFHERASRFVRAGALTAADAISRAAGFLGVDPLLPDSFISTAPIVDRYGGVHTGGGRTALSVQGLSVSDLASFQYNHGGASNFGAPPAPPGGSENASASVIQSLSPTAQAQMANAVAAGIGQPEAALAIAMAVKQTERNSSGGPGLPSAGSVTPNRSKPA